MSSENATFGDWLLAQLEERGLKQVDLAHLLGGATSTISAWANNDKRPTRRSCWAIAEALGLTRAEVLTAAGYPVPEAAPSRHGHEQPELVEVENDPLKDPRLRLWAAVEGDLPPTDVEFLRKMARMMLEDQKRGPDGLSD